MVIKNISIEELERRVEALINNATKSELIIKDKLDKAGIKYEFQYPIDAGASYYIADFYLPKYNTILEVDGIVHLDRKEYDKRRDTFLHIKGYKVKRVWNWDVKDFNVRELKPKEKNKKKKQKPLTKEQKNARLIQKLEKEARAYFNKR